MNDEHRLEIRFLFYLLTMQVERRGNDTGLCVCSNAYTRKESSFTLQTISQEGLQMSQIDDHSRAYLLFDQSELEYNFGSEHPMQPRRLVALMDLLESSGLWQRTGETITSPSERVQLPLRAAT